MGHLSSFSISIFHVTNGTVSCLRSVYLHCPLGQWLLVDPVNLKHLLDIWCLTVSGFYSIVFFRYEHVSVSRHVVILSGFLPDPVKDLGISFSSQRRGQDRVQRLSSYWWTCYFAATLSDHEKKETWKEPPPGFFELPSQYLGEWGRHF